MSDRPPLCVLIVHFLHITLASPANLGTTRAALREARGQCHSSEMFSSIRKCGFLT